MAKKRAEGATAEAPARAWEVGAVAHLASGGPDVTVHQIRGDGQLGVSWFDTELRLVFGFVPPACLRHGPRDRAPGAADA